MPKRKNSMPPEQIRDASVGRQIDGSQSEFGELTEMQREFVHQYVHNKMNQTAAARLAGFNQPGTAAHALVRNPKVIRAIAEEREEYARASQMSRQKVIDGFAESIDMARIQADPLTMIAGWREIGKMCGFYEPTKTKIEVTHNGQVMIQKLAAMSDEELLELASGDPGALMLEGEFLRKPEGESAEGEAPDADPA